jgi:polysaccharide biosynthesis/export protein
MSGKVIRVLAGSLLLSASCCGYLAGQTTNAGSPPSATLAAFAAQADGPSRAARSDDTFIIGDDDVLAINVWKNPDLTKQVTVRSDGMITLPLIGDVEAAGRTPSQLEQDLANRFKAYVNDPQVTVMVQEIHSLKFNILGQVTKPGAYSLATGTTVVDAIAIAGGLKDFAKKKGIYVLRAGRPGTEARYEFNYQDFIKGKNIKQNILLKPHDTVVVP